MLHTIGISVMMQCILIYSFYMRYLNSILIKQIQKDANASCPWLSTQYG